MAAPRATLPERERKAIQAFLAELVKTTNGGQTGAKELLGISQGAVWKAVAKADAGLVVLEACLTYSKMKRDRFVEKYGPPASTVLAVVVAEHPGKWSPDVVAEYHTRYGSDPSDDIARKLDDLAAHRMAVKSTGRKSSTVSRSAVHEDDGGRGSAGSGTTKARASRT